MSLATFSRDKQKPIHFTYRGRREGALLLSWPEHA